ncbi:MAG: hypothetical protein J1F02_02170 [Lachnospiraceae bacterium]|nr:hypothetical protein [Lachnospiraceae bacterium]
MVASKTTVPSKASAEKAVQTTLKTGTEAGMKKPVAEEPKAETKKETAAEKKPAEKKTTTKNTTAKKTTTRKSAAKKTTTRKTTTRKTTAKKKDTMEVFVQYKGNETSQSEIMKKVNAAWEAEGKKLTAIKRVKLYIKPEDGKAYYVINEGLKNGSTGAVDL